MELQQLAPFVIVVLILVVVAALGWVKYLKGKTNLEPTYESIITRIATFAIGQAETFLENEDNATQIDYARQLVKDMIAEMDNTFAIPEALIDQVFDRVVAEIKANA